MGQEGPERTFLFAHDASHILMIQAPRHRNITSPIRPPIETRTRPGSNRFSRNALSTSPIGPSGFLGLSIAAVYSPHSGEARRIILASCACWRRIGE